MFPLVGRVSQRQLPVDVVVNVRVPIPVAVDRTDQRYKLLGYGGRERGGQRDLAMCVPLALLPRIFLKKNAQFTDFAVKKTRITLIRLLLPTVVLTIFMIFKFMKKIG